MMMSTMYVQSQTELQCTYSAGLFMVCLQSAVPIACIGSAGSVPQGTALKGLCRLAYSGRVDLAALPYWSLGYRGICVPSHFWSDYYI